MRLEEAPRLSRAVLVLSGALLIAISLIWVVPEVAERQGWSMAVAWVCAGFALLWAINRFVYPVCPACSHTHHHEECHDALHGFAAPLLIAAGVHSFFDGWGLMMSGQVISSQGTPWLRWAFLLGIGLHKLPEGLALGAMSRAAMTSHWRAFAACSVAEAMTLAGGLAASGIAAEAGQTWAGILLAIAAGTFIYLGYHAVEGELHRRAAARHHAHVQE